MSEVFIVLVEIGQTTSILSVHSTLDRAVDAAMGDYHRYPGQQYWPSDPPLRAFTNYGDYRYSTAPLPLSQGHVVRYHIRREPVD